MRPLRAFLFSPSDTGQWCCQTFRDFEPLVEAAIAANGERKHPVGLHIGFERPDTEAVTELLAGREAFVYLSFGALGTMPAPVLAGARSIGFAGNTAFHIALEGFGYQIEDPNYEAVTIAKTTIVAQQSNSAIDPTGWVAQSAKLVPNLASKLSAAGIFDDESYSENEIRLDADTRHLVGIRRYELLENERPNAKVIVNNLRSAPPWLLDAPIHLLNLSVRSNNVCTAHKIRTVSDFGKIGLNGLYRLPNLGQKSVHEISRELIRLFNTGQPLKVISEQSGLPSHLSLDDIHKNADRLVEFDSNDLAGDHPPEPYAQTFADINGGFVEAAQLLTEGERGIWAGRIGFRCESMTLQKIASELNLTRERVRQIEVKIYRKLSGHPFWMALSRRILGHLRERTSPMYLQGLPVIDPWFKGVEELANPLREVCQRIPNLGFHVLAWNNALVVSRLSQAQWIESLDDAKRVLMALSDQSLGEQDVMAQIAGVLLGKGSDMCDALWSEVSRHCVWSEGPVGSRTLTGFGKSISTLVTGILQASEAPLHLDEIFRRAKRHAIGEALSTAYIHNAVSEVAMLYRRGTYGLMKHCPLTPSQMLSIRAEVEDIVSGGSPTKQWHCNELYEELLNRGLSFDGKLSKYIVNIALANSPNLAYLRRMIWAVRGQWNEGAEARLDVKQAVISLLQDEGTPMTTAQIRSRLIEGRGLNAYFQIWASSPLIRLGPGLWGLETRDVNLVEAGKLAYRLLKELSSRQEGVHVSEAAAFLGLASENEVTTLVSIAQKDGLRIDRSQYCYLHPWGESRRMSIMAAAISTLRSHDDGLPLVELHQFVERLVKRKIERLQLRGLLQNIDAVHDSESGRWKFAGPIEEEDEDDEGSTNLSIEM